MKRKLDDLHLTYAAMHQHGWEVVLLAPLSKRPAGDSWHMGTPQEVITHVKNGGNIGLVCGPEWIGTMEKGRRSSGVAVLDFDEPGALAEMSVELGPLLPWVQTGRGLLHCYVKWEDGLPSRMMWKNRRVGEIQRGPALQHVVMPPSIHPDTRLPYVWRVDPNQPLPELPEEWRAYLKSSCIPDYIKEGDRRGQPEEEPWRGPSPEELQAWALAQPGARQRRHGIKFQCPGCRKEGRDRSRDNAIMYSDGRWGCAVNPRHTKDIAMELGITSVAHEVLGDSEDDLTDVSIDDLD